MRDNGSASAGRVPPTIPAPATAARRRSQIHISSPAFVAHHSGVTQYEKGKQKLVTFAPARQRNQDKAASDRTASHSRSHRGSWAWATRSQSVGPPPTWVGGKRDGRPLRKGAAESELYAVDKVQICEARFAHMTSLTTEAKISCTSGWISSHIRRRRGRRPPKAGGSDRSSDMSARPCRSILPAPLGGTRLPVPSSATGQTNPRRTGASSADRTSVRPATTSSSDARPGPPDQSAWRSVGKACGWKPLG